MPSKRSKTSLTRPEIESLVQQALAARRNAYAPYSNYLVGAALLMDDGRIFTGCNVENASYSLTNCAERVAVGAAVAAGARKIVAVAVATKDGGSPCGSCRQVLAEFGLDAAVYISNEAGKYRTTSVAKLLPDNFVLKTGS